MMYIEDSSAIPIIVFLFVIIVVCVILLVVWAKFGKVKQCCMSAVSNYHLKTKNGEKKHPMINIIIVSSVSVRECYISMVI